MNKPIITKIAGYKKCLTSVRETCSSKFYIGQHRKIGHKISVGRCKRLCSRDSKCQFVSYNSANYCFKYRSCDETRYFYAYRRYLRERGNMSRY